MEQYRLSIVSILQITLTFSNYYESLLSETCLPRKSNYSSVVCVCNETYCDTLPQFPKLSAGQYVSYTSSEDGDRFKEEFGTLTLNSKYGIFHTEIILDPSETFQKIYGWGGAFTDSVGINIESLQNTSTRNSLLSSYFSQNGLEYNLCRVPIGGTDFSTHSYSYDDGEEDPELNNFKLAPEDYTYKIPLIKDAQALSGGNLKLFASAWTAPTWMKHNHASTGPDILRFDMYQTWANYFLKFLRAYKNENVEFWGITTGNEPTTGLLPLTINSVGWLPNLLANFIVDNLGPTLRNSEFSKVQLITVDDQIFSFPIGINLIFSLRQKANQYVDGFGVHWYTNQFFPHNLLNLTHYEYPDKFILATEASNNVPQLGDWNRGEKYASDIIADLQNWVVGWVDWNMVLDTKGGPTYIHNYLDAPIIVDAEKGEFYKQPMYYTLGHFSKFLPRDSIRLKTHVSFSFDLDAVGFVNNKSDYVAIILNRSQNSKNILVGNLGKEDRIRMTMPRKSITTIIFKDNV